MARTVQVPRWDFGAPALRERRAAQKTSWCHGTPLRRQYNGTHSLSRGVRTLRPPASGNPKIDSPKSGIHIMSDSTSCTEDHHSPCWRKAQPLAEAPKRRSMDQPATHFGSTFFDRMIPEGIRRAFV